MKTLGSEIARPGEQEPARARDKRHSIFLIGSIRRGLGQPKERALCRNLSRTGMRAESRHPWVTGTRILCELRGIGEIAAKVAWSRGQAMGIRFDSPIDPARVWEAAKEQCESELLACYLHLKPASPSRPRISSPARLAGTTAKA